MKTFIFSVKTRSTKFGNNVILNIYRMKNNKPIFLGNVQFNTKSYKGNKCEVISFLVYNQHLPKKCMDEGSYMNFEEFNKSFKIYEV